MNRRHFLKMLTSVGVAATLPIGWIVERDRVVIAASNASPASKRAADVVCTGRNDGTTIQAALDSMAPGRQVFINGGTFFLDRPIDFSRHSGFTTGCHFIGQYNRAPLLAVA